MTAVPTPESLQDAAKDLCGRVILGAGPHPSDPAVVLLWHQASIAPGPGVIAARVRRIDGVAGVARSDVAGLLLVTIRGARSVGARR